MPHLHPIHRITQLRTFVHNPARSVQVPVRTLSSLPPTLSLPPRRLVQKRHFTVMSYNLRPDGSVEYIGKKIPRAALPPDVGVAQGSECACDGLTVTARLATVTIALAVSHTYAYTYAYATKRQRRCSCHDMLSARYCIPRERTGR
jgi:hypothetical protein